MSEPPIARMELLLEELGLAITPLLDHRVDLFGHSMGTLIAFELTRRLRALGAPQPARLFLSGRRAPHIASRSPSMHALPHDRFVEQLRIMGGTSEAIFNEPELLAMFLPALRADLEAVETWEHRAEPPLNIDVVVTGGCDDTMAPPEALEAWRQHATGNFAMHRFPGGHFYLHEGPELLALLNRALEI